MNLTNRLFAAIFAVAVFFCANLSRADEPLETAGAETVYVVKIHGAISTPQTYILKRSIREANANGATALIIDMNTPGGDLGTTLEIMQLLSDFKGKTICYVNPEAISAGSFIAVACDEIWFSPKGIMGAAEAVTSMGGDVDESMRRKITSYLAAKVRSISGENSRKAQVQRAMNDPDYVLEIGGKVLKKKGELLSLTASEAAEVLDGAPVLSDGTVGGVKEIAEKSVGANARIVEIVPGWADEVAKFISSISPIVMGLAFFLIIMDFKSGSLGALAGIGAAMLVIVFLGAHLSGIAGYEALIVMGVGLVLIALEIFIFPGLIIPAATGALMVLGALAWMLGDIWPSRGIEYNAEAIALGFGKVVLGMAIGLGLVFLFARFMPKTAIWHRLVLNQTDAATHGRGSAVMLTPENDPYAQTLGGVEIKVGSRGTAASALMPSGQISVEGKIADATSVFGHIDMGESIEVVAKKDFNFLVKKVD